MAVDPVASLVGGKFGRMYAWAPVAVPSLPNSADSEPGRLTLFDTASQSLMEVGPTDGSAARMYVCGITPYDATHLGHANTYVTFDLIQRVWRDLGLEVDYTQNVTDVDDPLLERAAETGQEWEELAEDQMRGGKMATEHLIELGHVEIVHVAGPQDWIEAESRMRGYLHALSDADLPTRAPILGDWTADFGYRAALELSHRLDFTAVFAANDAMAVGLMHGFRDVGIDVPRRVSIVGFDDIPLAAHSWPPLTTVHQQFAGLGRRAVTELLRLINADDAPPLLASVEPSLVVRASTARAFGHQ